MRLAAMNRFAISLLAAATLALPAFAADFRTIAASGTVAYDAPSIKATRVFVTGGDYPVEVMVSVENWAKVRDKDGDLFWVEKKALSENRMVVVTAQTADVRAAPSEQAAVAFQAGKNVVLELAEVSAPGWVKVRHRDGQTGFIRVKDVWGW